MTRWRWPVVALVSVLVAVAVLGWFVRGVRSLDDPRVVARPSVGESAVLGPASLRVDTFRAVTTLPDRYGEPGETIDAPQGTRFVEVTVTQTFVAVPDEEYYCTDLAVDTQGRTYDGRDAGGGGQKGDTSLCSVDEKVTVKVGDRRALVFRYVVPDAARVAGVRIDLPGSGTAVLLTPSSPV